MDSYKDSAWRDAAGHVYTTRTTCRCCGSSDLTPIFSLGDQYVSNFVEPAADLGKYPKCPLDLELCGNCTLVQLKHTAPQELLYSGHYWYRSGTSAAMRDALRDVTAKAEELVDLQPGDVVLDIGSNDGTLLRSYTRLRDKKTGMSDPGEAIIDCDYNREDRYEFVRVGCEPATNLRTEGSQGIDVLINDFWSYNAYLQAMEKSGLEWGPKDKAKVITACGMFYDLEDPNQFIADVTKALAPDGLFIAQLMCLHNMLNVGDVGNICHEHLEYYTLMSLDRLLGKHGLRILDIETNNVNGQSYRLYIRHAEASPVFKTENVPAAKRVLDAFESERTMLEHLAEHFAKWGENKGRVIAFIKDQRDCGKSVWVYGASTKGNTILQWLGLDHTWIRAACDTNSEKWGKVTVGTKIPIFSKSVFREHLPDYALVLPWGFLDEFITEEVDQEWRKRGGKFIVPIPELRII